MSSFTNADAFQLWAIGLCVAVTLVGISLGAIIAFLWKRRPEKLDALRQSQLETRLSELADTAQPGKSA